MALNKVSDLNDHLFIQLERLNDETIGPNEMELEIKKAKAISGVAAQIIKNNTSILKAAEIVSKYGATVPDSFGVKKIS